MRIGINVALACSLACTTKALSSFGHGHGHLPHPLARLNETDHAAAAAPAKFLQSGQATVPAVVSAPAPVQSYSCMPDIPGSLATTGLAMLMGMLLVWTLVGFLMEQHPSAEESIAAAAGASGPRPARRPTIKSLDGMRTVLITYIIIVHFPTDSPTSLLSVLHDPGWSMQFFMVLSGFVAMYVMEGKADSFTWSTGCQWLGRRLARLAALHHAAILLDYVRVSYIGGECIANQCRPLAAWPMNAMFMQGIFPLRICGMPTDHPSWNYVHFNANGVGWFAACLAWISVAFPVLYNHRPRSSMDLKFGLLFIVVALRISGEVWCPTWAMWGGAGFLHPYAFMPLRLLEFWAGMLTAQVASQMTAQGQTWQYWGWVFDVSLVLGFAGVAYTMRNFGASPLRTGEYYMTPIWCIVCAAAALAVQIPEKDRQSLSSGPLHEVLSSVHMTYLAQYSYGAYQLHQVTLRTLFTVGAPAFLQGFPSNALVGWIAGILATKFIEVPAMDFIESSARLTKQLKGAPLQYT
eukprot:TRINITY_DN114185_c0_g1_i1.p1 TRINITY_DN114185_c0_g1~~TRINITY_DN114185_c0_g1_i1.p1  ORF type:complete len:521 (+),score=65.28 TRINITY_DN114185_c0_g1_i1:79-1641(+)